MEKPKTKTKKYRKPQEKKENTEMCPEEIVQLLTTILGNDQIEIKNGMRYISRETKRDLIFPVKLNWILTISISNEVWNKLIGWHGDEISFYVTSNSKEREDLINLMIKENFFTGKTFDSFQRQLNLYGFRTNDKYTPYLRYFHILNKKDDGSIVTYFKKGQPDLLLHIHSTRKGEVKVLFSRTEDSSEREHVLGTAFNSIDDANDNLAGMKSRKTHERQSPRMCSSIDKESIIFKDVCRDRLLSSSSIARTLSISDSWSSTDTDINTSHSSYSTTTTTSTFSTPCARMNTLNYVDAMNINDDIVNFEGNSTYGGVNVIYMNATSIVQNSANMHHCDYHSFRDENCDDQNLYVDMLHPSNLDSVVTTGFFDDDVIAYTHARTTAHITGNYDDTDDGDDDDFAEVNSIASNSASYTPAPTHILDDTSTPDTSTSTESSIVRNTLARMDLEINTFEITTELFKTTC